MSKKIVVLLEVLAIIIAFVAYLFLEVIPEYRRELGSSDSFVSSKSFQNMIEVRIDDQTDIAFLINSNGSIYHLFFFDNTSLILYNKNIENHSIEDILPSVIQTLMDSKLLRDTSNVLILHTNEEYYSSFQSIWNEYSTRYLFTIKSDVCSLRERALAFGIDAEDYDSILLELDFYSKEVIKELE